MRDIGYSFEAAIADIIDNSLAAKARTIDIRFGWADGLPWIAIVDDGKGMGVDELRDAMRPGSQSPLVARMASDLGRFGLGMKTASFSQCRELTVISRQASVSSAMRWDLDLVASTDDWTLLELAEASLATLPAVDLLGKCGTVILWRKIDRLELTGGEQVGHSSLNDMMGVVRVHLARVYHRFILGESGQPKVLIRINSLPVEAFDPFHAASRATQQLPEEVVAMQGGEVTIQPFILPHHSNVSPSDYERLAGAEGYLRNQGFYVYRNRRLIVWGTWFRLAKQEELTKLARVRIDVPNTLDHLWGIDVRKSRAHPPMLVRQRLRQVVERIRGSAKRPYTQRGVLIMQPDLRPVWERKAFNDRIEYSINELHPIIEDLLTDVDERTRTRIRSVLRMVATSFPHAAFFSDYATEPKQLDARDGDLRLLVGLARLVADSFPGIDGPALKNLIASTEPFASWPTLLDQISSEAVREITN
jgi:hypothetical protein